MMKHIRGVLPLLVALLSLTTFAVAHGDDDNFKENGGWWGDLLEEKSISLERILETPEAFRGLTVTFVVQFHRLGKIDNPFYTKFEGDWYTNFSAWPDNSKLWKKKEYREDFPYLFVKRMSEGAKMITNAEKYSRWVITAEVSEVFRGKPWIEVLGMKKLTTAMSEPSLVQLVKGYTLMDLRRHDAAAQAFRTADHPTLPVNIRTMAMRHEAACLSEVGKVDMAIGRLNEALAIVKDETSTIQLLAHCESRRAKQGGGPVLVPSRPKQPNRREEQAVPVSIPSEAQPQPQAQPLPQPVKPKPHTGPAITPVTDPVPVRPGTGTTPINQPARRVVPPSSGGN